MSAHIELFRDKPHLISGSIGLSVLGMSEIREVFRKDYRAPAYLCPDLRLEFRLSEEETEVEAWIRFERNGERVAPLVLDGEELELRLLEIDGSPVAKDDYRIEGNQLKVDKVPRSFEMHTVVAIKPQENLTLSGLYKSSGNFCTQCEAEGFRRITYFLDRPDVVARYSVKLIAEKARYPVLLANGNRIDQGETGEDYHYAVWEDPFPKPSYLFAAVAGKLRCNRGHYTTRSGRDIDLEIWVNEEDLDKTDHALESLKESMRWDEEVFGLEYDLDIYMIVAVPDFNMGAMENKGLNIFNTKYVLAKPETATDADFEAVEGVIAHEYFHNWTGNRVTCRDWFQLTLKEGLTVFRDEQFTADMTSKSVKRIQDVRNLRFGQFAEDAGPMSHPIRPESYVAMDNFYSSTVYRKGSEVVRMYNTLLGTDGFRKGMDLYFDRHDGQAVTCDDFRAAMADANGADLNQFERWYDQNGTPEITITERYHAETGKLDLELEQKSGARPDHAPFHIPIRVALFSDHGSQLECSVTGEKRREHLLELRERKEVYSFTGLAKRPIVSALRGFSAPVKLKGSQSRRELAFLMGADTDDFNRWDSGQRLAKALILENVKRLTDGEDMQVDPLFLDAYETMLRDQSIDPKFKGLALQLPTVGELLNDMAVMDPFSVQVVRRSLLRDISAKFREQLKEMYSELNTEKPYRYEKSDVNRRYLKNTILAILSSAGEEAMLDLAWRQFESADNMTDQQAAFACLKHHSNRYRDESVSAFYRQWEGEALVIDKWFAEQATSEADDSFERVKSLSDHPDFSLSNPNRAFALLVSFCRSNLAAFHREDGEAYSFLADKLIEIDRLNPQSAAKVALAFNQWKRFDRARQDLMKEQLLRIEAQKNLSKDTREIVTRALA